MTHQGAFPDVAIVSAVRTPIGKFGGGLKDVPAGDLGAVALRAAVERAGICGSDVDEVFFGHARQAGCGPNVARQVAVRGGLPVEVPAAGINQACGSGLRAVFLGAEAIMLGRARVVAAGGVENMSRVPYMMDRDRARGDYRLGPQAVENAELVDCMYRDGFNCPLCGQIMGQTAETLAEQYAISREEQDAFALSSQHKCEKARQEGAFDAEIVPVPPSAARDGSLDDSITRDEHPRPSSTLEGLAKLKPVFRTDGRGTVTAGNASGVTDGAAALVLMSREEAERRGAPIMAWLRQYSVVGLEPAVMGLGAALAARRVLEQAGQCPEAIDLFEVNEAFAAQVLACQALFPLPMDRVNIHGGAIALGHPIGCTGARITVTLLHAMRQRGARTGLATLCVSGGMGLAALFEAP